MHFFFFQYDFMKCNLSLIIKKKFSKINHSTRFFFQSFYTLNYYRKKTIALGHRVSHVVTLYNITNYYLIIHMNAERDGKKVFTYLFIERWRCGSKAKRSSKCWFAHTCKTKKIIIPIPIIIININYLN